MTAKEFSFKGFRANGFLMLFVLFLLLGITVGSFFLSTPGIITGILLSVLWLICLFGFVKLEPNEAIVMIFFGKY
ncbi:MAG TPA: band 7 protein, partial [Porphyromonadaceae bacterium]|nr:band 7 protein [Porphyromonadaceae bacterium]HCM21733.1 band 7 protein [Porphyromonadaceae bacterium]